MGDVLIHTCVEVLKKINKDNIVSLEFWNSKSALLISILEECSNLRRIKLQGLSFRKEFVRKLLCSSSINEIHFSGQYHFRSDDAFFSFFPINHSVQKLHVGPCLVHQRNMNKCWSLCLQLFKYFSSLEYLLAADLPCWVVKHILEKNGKLKSLQLLSPGKRVEASLPETLPPEVYYLKDLRHLRLEDGCVGYIDKVMKMLDLTNLRYLEISCQSPETEMLKLPNLTPLLESLSLELRPGSATTPVNLSFDDWYTCISGLKKLRFLLIKNPRSNIDPFNDEQYMQIFEACSLLRYLRHVTLRYSVQCFFDILKNEISFNVFLPNRLYNHYETSLSPYLTGENFKYIFERS